MILLMLCGLVPPVLALDVPAYHGYVNDYAGMLSPETEKSLNQALQSFDGTDSTQIAVLTINSLTGDSLEEFSIRVADSWKIGHKGRDNGALLLIAKEDRKIRIEVGRGLEGVMTDLASGRIIDNIISPHFKEGNFDQGITAGVDAMIKVTRGEYTAETLARRSRKGGQDPPLLFKLIFFLLIITAFLGRASKPLGIGVGALLLPLAFFFGLTSALPFFMLLLLIPLGGFAGWLLPLMVGNMLVHHRTGGYYGGGFGGGGGFRGGGGFGGFGGGGFGGGGASGGW